MSYKDLFGAREEKLPEIWYELRKTNNCPIGDNVDVRTAIEMVGVNPMLVDRSTSRLYTIASRGPITSEQERELLDLLSDYGGEFKLVRSP